MRIFVIGIGLIVLLWSGYWVIGSRDAAQGARDWLQDRTADGWAADYADVRTRGFPNRFDTTITAPALADPAADLGWAAPFVQILRLSYKPEHVIVVFPNTQTVSVAEQDIAVSTGKMQASAVFRRDADRQFDRANLAANAVSLTSNAGWSASADTGLAAVRLTPARVNAYDLGLDLLAVTLTPDALTEPIVLNLMRIDATVTLDAPLDRSSLDAAWRAVTEIDLRQFQAVQGSTEISATARLAVDAAGRPSGNVTVLTKGWREFLQTGEELGWLPKGIADTLKSALGVVAGFSGSGDNLEFELTLRNGAMSIGPINLGSISLR